jgi:hypothetical protein
VDITKTQLKLQGFMVATLLGIPMAVALLLWLADGTQRGSFAGAHIFSARYIAANIVLLLMMVPIFWAAKRRPAGTPLTWGEAAVGAAYVFAVLFWLYGVLPHEFLNWADSELAWRPDKKIIGPEGSWASWWGFWKDIPITVNKQAIRDVVAVVIYGVGLGGFIWGFAFWNDREKKAAAAKSVEPVSAYGRPLVAKAGKG